jgi:hypothetical protein
MIYEVGMVLYSLAAKLRVIDYSISEIKEESDISVIMHCFKKM